MTSYRLMSLSDGRWSPSITGTLNQTCLSDEEASTFDTIEEAAAVGAAWLEDEEWRIEPVS